MRIFDAPIHANDQSWSKIVQQKQPILLYLFDRPQTTVDQALQQIAKQYAGELLVVRIEVGSNPETYRRYQSPALPALVTLKNGEPYSTAAPVQTADVSAHAAYLLGKGPKPAGQTASAANASSSGAAEIPLNVNDASFQRVVLQSDLPVLVDFWAPWCGPCRMVAPVVEQIARKYAGRVRVVKVNVDESPRTASAYQTMSIPTLITFRQGQVVGRVVGAQPQPVIEQLVEKVL